MVYEKLPATGSAELYVRDLSATTPVQFTNDAVDQDEPQFNKEGSRIVFSQDDGTGTGRHVIGMIASAGGAITVIDPFPGTDVSVRAPSMNYNSTRIAFVAEGDSTSNTGVFTCDLKGGTLGPRSRTPSHPSLCAPSTGRTSACRAAGSLSLHLNRPRARR